MTGLPSTRRVWLGTIGATALGAGTSLALATPARRPRVAAVFTELRRLSHAYHILSNLMGRLLFRGQWIDPGVDVVSFYADQFPKDDMARDASHRFGVPLFKTIDEALCVGGRDLAVDAVLLIGEHGRYPSNELGQRMYPRKEFFDQIVATMRRSDRFVPVFNDKHLSYRWDWAKAMYDQARTLGIPLLAGSSVPLAQRLPAVDLPADAVIEEAISIHGGGIESYDFHALEVLQSLIEGRGGGETGIVKVQLLESDACKRAGEQGKWSTELVEAAMHAERDARMARRKPSPSFPTEPFVPRHAMLLTYKDGTKATILTIGRDGNRWNCAYRLQGQSKTQATAFYSGPWGNWNLFGALSNAIAHFFRTGQPQYPVERTLLVTGVLDAAMHSRHDRGQIVETPHLEFSYTAQDFRSFCETGESWNVITADSPEPQGFEPGSG